MLKLLAVSALLCAMMALSSAEAAAEPEPEAAPAGELDVQKRHLCHLFHHIFRHHHHHPCHHHHHPCHHHHHPCHHHHHPCHSPWTKIGCRYFHYVSQPMTWHQAEQNCRSLGGHLASVHSHHEHQQIRALIRQGANGEPDTWIGGTDACCEGHWHWSDGTCFNYKGWCCGEPNNLGDQDCLLMNFSCQKCWDDRQCSHKHPSVCVRNIG